MQAPGYNMMLHVHVFVAWLCSTTFHWQMFEQAKPCGSGRKLPIAVFQLTSEVLLQVLKTSGHFPHHLALRKSCQKCSNLGLGFGLGLDTKLTCEAQSLGPFAAQVLVEAGRSRRVWRTAFGRVLGNQTEITHLGVRLI